MAKLPFQGYGCMDLENVKGQPPESLSATFSQHAYVYTILGGVIPSSDRCTQTSYAQNSSVAMVAQMAAQASHPNATPSRS